jgi:hypothetical protein
MVHIGYCQPCDVELTPVENSEIQYKYRQNRCEGFYSSKVSSGTIEVVGVIKGEFHFNLEKNEIVEISSPFVKKQLIRVRAVGIPIKTYYRMDTEIAPGAVFSLPVGEIIYPQKLSDEKIGVFGWIEQGADKIYVPLAASAKLGKNPNNDKIMLYLRTSTDVENLKWRTANMVDGICLTPGDWNDTQKSSYRSGQPISISLPEAKALCVEVAAKEKNSALWLKRNIRLLLRD